MLKLLRETSHSRARMERPPVSKVKHHHPPPPLPQAPPGALALALVIGNGT